ncbi:MAG: c-type cytochrome [Candidatus Kapabacteria bacterium]|nr:c-type cytochrome [Candidatus Kapabacteria bacterium]
MSNDQNEKLLEHDADGIRELDNDLPRWWLYGFYFTIVMSAIYIFYYHVYTGPDWNILWYGARGSAAEYAAQIKEAEVMIANAPKAKKEALVLLTDKESLAKGAEIFNGINNLCYTCHREDLGGQVGPNLTDEYWIHGCSLEQIVANITSGFPEKGMLPYGSGNKLTDRELMQVASYIISKKGTNPPDPKPIEEGRDVICSSEPAM